MGFQYDDLPGWEFTVVEQSAGVYKLTAVRDGGITGGGTDTDPEALLDEYKRWAHMVEVDLAQRRRDAKRRIGSCQVVGFSDVLRPLSYLLCYYWCMAQRDKRSVSFPPDLAKAIDEAAAASGTSFSAWIAETASHRLRLESGRQGVAEWEAEHGPLSERELAEGLARARDLLGRASAKRSA